MHRFIILCAILPVCGCVSVLESRYLEAQYCPDALILKGTERLVRREAGRPIMAAELVRINVACEVSFEGDIGKPSFKMTGLDFSPVFHGRIEIKDGAAASGAVPLFIVLLRKSDEEVIRQHVFDIPMRGGNFRRSFDWAPDSTGELNKAEYVILGGFIVNDEQISRNLKPYLEPVRKK